MTGWGTWNVAPCEAADSAGTRCALATGHAGDHRTTAAVTTHEQSAWVWRLLIAVGVGVLLLYLLYGLP